MNQFLDHTLAIIQHIAKIAKVKIPITVLEMEIAAARGGFDKVKISSHRGHFICYLDCDGKIVRLREFNLLPEGTCEFHLSDNECFQLITRHIADIKEQKQYIKKHVDKIR